MAYFREEGLGGGDFLARGIDIIGRGGVGDVATDKGEGAIGEIELDVVEIGWVESAGFPPGDGLRRGGVCRELGAGMD